MDSLQGKVALVTGGGRGIGREISLELARAGCDVAINYHSRKEDAENTAKEIQALGRRAYIVQADVAKSADVKRMIAETEGQLGSIDILVNNAGRILIQSIEQMTEDSWNDMLSVNLTSCFLVTQAVLPSMRARRWGRIINLTSVAGQAGSMMGVHYAAAKAGVIGMTRSYARILAKEGITVNAIAPALVATEMVLANPNIKADVMIPVGRFGTVDEVASSALLLAQNGYITGQTLGVNGGIYLG